MINGADQVGKSQACSQLGLIYASSAGGAMRWSGTRARQPALGVGRRPTADRARGAASRDDPTRRHSPDQRHGAAGTGGDLWQLMMTGPAKARDLARDPRVVLKAARALQASLSLGSVPGARFQRLFGLALTLTVSTSPSVPWKSAGLAVYSGSRLLAAVAAICRSEERLRGCRPAARTAAQI